MNYLKLLSLILGFMLLGRYVHWLFFLPAFFLLTVLCSALLTPPYTEGPPSCPSCGSRHYTVDARPDRWRGAGNIFKATQNSYSCRCLECGKRWRQRTS